MTRDINSLKHMLEDVRDIQDFIKDNDYNSFKDSTLLKKAVCMSLINIGELTKGL